MSVVDKLFTCQEAPVWTPATFDPSSLPPCLSCTLRLSSQLPGPGSLQPSALGFTVDENPTTVLAINGIQYNLVSAELVVPGLHRLYGQQNVCDAEYVITFRNTRDTSKVVLFCIPLVIGDGHGNGYFTNLGIVDRGRPTLSALITPETGILTYPGASLSGRTKSSPYPQQICSPISYPVTYYVVLTPSYILSSDYQRLHSQLAKSHVGGPVPVTEITMSRAKALLTYINTITLVGSSKESSSEDAMNTNALKCYRIDPKKDIKNNKVYIGGAPNENTLAKELQNAAEDGGAVPDTAYIKPGDIEQIISIVLGVAIAILICAAIAYFLWKGTFSKYIAVQKLYSTSSFFPSFKLPTTRFFGAPPAPPPIK